MNFGKSVKMMTPEIFTQRHIGNISHQKGFGESLTIKLHARSFDVELYIVNRSRRSFRKESKLHKKFRR